MNTTQNIRYLHKKLEDVSKNVYCLKQYVKNNPGGGGGDYVLTPTKITTALGYTPISNTHASNNITQTLISSWNGAVTNSHTHSNKSVLDATTASFTTTLKTKLDGLENYQLTSTKVTTALGFTPMNSTHPASAVTSAKITNWDKAFTDSHTHSNKTVLDGITSAKVNSWDAKLSGIVGDKLRYVLMNPDGSFNVALPSEGDIVKALGLDSDNNPINTEVTEFKSINLSDIEPTSLELDNQNFDRVDYPTLNRIYFKCGNEWSYINITKIL